MITRVKVDTDDKYFESSGIIECPDGISRVVVMPEWYWQAFDHIVDVDRETPEQLIWDVWASCMVYGDDIENDFRGILPYYIFQRMKVINPNLKQESNENVGSGL